jgi:hypothetical protein
MRFYSRTNGTVGLVDNLYSISQQNTEAIYQREMESYADGNRLFRICSVCEFKIKNQIYLFLFFF